MVSATFVCQVTLYASERAASGYRYLVGSHCSRRKYQHLSYVLDMLVPVRYMYTSTNISMNGGYTANDIIAGSINQSSPGKSSSVPSTALLVAAPPPYAEEVNSGTTLFPNSS
jgi:hypothetical protein